MQDSPRRYSCWVNSGPRARPAALLLKSLRSHDHTPQFPCSQVVTSGTAPAHHFGYGMWQRLKPRFNGAMRSNSLRLEQWLKDLGTALHMRMEPVLKEPLPDAMVGLVLRLNLCAENGTQRRSTP